MPRLQGCKHVAEGSISRWFVGHKTQWSTEPQEYWYKMARTCVRRLHSQFSHCSDLLPLSLMVFELEKSRYHFSDISSPIYQTTSYSTNIAATQSTHVLGVTVCKFHNNHFIAVATAIITTVYSKCTYRHLYRSPRHSKFSGRAWIPSYRD